MPMNSVMEGETKGGDTDDFITDDDRGDNHLNTESNDTVVAHSRFDVEKVSTSGYCAGQSPVNSIYDSSLEGNFPKVLPVPEAGASDVEAEKNQITGHHITIEITDSSKVNGKSVNH